MRIRMPSTRPVPWLFLVGVSAIGCAGTDRSAKTAPVVRECALRLDDPLATRVNTSPGPYAVYISFEPRGRNVSAHPFRWGNQVWDCDGDGQACVAIVPRWMLLRLCNDAAVRDIEAVQ